MADNILLGLVVWSALAVFGFRVFKKIIKTGFMEDNRGEKVIERVRILLIIVATFILGMGFVALFNCYFKFGR
jgi:ABC-type multidrug transport system fused ATPase/permease subunit